MYRDTVFFYRTDISNLNCLKVFNQEGDELSLSGDDSCGAMKHLARCQMAIFPEGGNTMRGDEVYHVSPEELLKNLAGHLGYTVTKKENKETRIRYHLTKRQLASLKEKL